MRFRQWEQVIGQKEPPKTQTRRVNFPYELAQQLWKHGWKYPRSRRYRDTYAHPWYVPWGEWQQRHPVTDEHIAEANRILANNTITLPVQPGQGKKAVGRIRITKIRRERLGDISQADCFAEGIIWRGGLVSLVYSYRGNEGPLWFETSSAAYANLSDSIYGKGAWDRMKDEDVFVLDWATESEA